MSKNSEDNAAFAGIIIGLLAAAGLGVEGISW